MMNQVGGFFSCKYDADAFYAQKVTLYPKQYQRWVVAMHAPGSVDDEGVRHAVLNWLQYVGSVAGLKVGVGSNVSAVKVLTISEHPPQLDNPAIRQKVSPLPEIHSNPLSSNLAKNIIYVGFEFWYDGSAVEGNWPWEARGFLIKCPEDALSGLIAALSPLKAPPPPTLLEELEKPLQEAAISLHDGIVPSVKALGDKTAAIAERTAEFLAAPAKGAVSLLLFGASGFLLWNLWQNRAPQRSYR